MSIPTAEKVAAIKARRATALKRKYEYTKRWKAANRAKENATTKAYRDKHRERVRLQNREWSRANKERRAEQKQGYRRVNLEQYREMNRKYRAANRETLALKQRARVYGLSVEELQALLEAHGGNCGACGDPFPSNSKHRHIDHCHKTGKVRGLLCRACNLAIGNAQDSVRRLEAMIAYLKRAS